MYSGAPPQSARNSRWRDIVDLYRVILPANFPEELNFRNFAAFANRTARAVGMIPFCLSLPTKTPKSADCWDRPRFFAGRCAPQLLSPDRHAQLLQSLPTNLTTSCGELGLRRVPPALGNFARR